ncbi:Fungalysin metallopeptidase-domain-containing protein [Mycena floridula]|nr:Fungalysin metallopeptidase-domain-containing protein [Mycena floridula]KAJ7580569.1 Fungalysin metallopeptidase-domain-containing protein [Mycena floridula]
MFAFNILLKSIILAVVYASHAAASPYPQSSKHATHRIRHFTRDLKLEAFHPVSSFEIFGQGIEHPDGPSLVPRSLQDSAESFITSHLKINASQVGFNSGYAAETASYAYLKQFHDGIPFANAVANVAFKGDKIVSVGSSFVRSDQIAPSSPSVDLESAISTAEAALTGSHNAIPPTIEYLVKADGTVALTHVIQIQNDKVGSWFEAFVDAHSGELISVVDFVAEAAYTVLPIIKETLPEGQETVEDPADLLASPFGWHSDGTDIINTTTTAGNNVIAFKATQLAVTPESSDPLVFDYPYDVTLPPTGGGNIDASRTNAFYIINEQHDLTYRYGFTEAAFNFQNNNFDKGGLGNDRVLMSVQDASGTNNANFATPADGASGTCRMFIWTETPIDRDGVLENDIPVHEMTHGLTNRMTGGGTGRCLQTTEAGGMGEGWSDAMAEWTEHKDASVPDYVLGQYVTNTTGGIRTHPYSTSPITNPLRYSSVSTLHEVHAIGEVWANMLHNVYAALVAAHDFSTIARTNPDGTEGNIVFLHLFIDALAIQPCNPTFVNARDAWIQADVNRYEGVNACFIWTAFASRGLGVNAANFVDDSTVPEGC